MDAEKLQNLGSNFGNNLDLENLWAVKASEHAEIYFNLICSVDPSCLLLSPVDDEIYTLFRKTFPNMRVDVLDEQEMKSGLTKLEWHGFIESFKGKVEDYNFGTLVRLDCSKGYSSENSTFCVRTQFLAIEIARNRENYNSKLRFTHGDQEDSKKEHTS